VEIGDIVDTPEEAAPASRKRQGRAARNSAGVTTTESNEETATRKRNGRGALTRRRNGNRSRGNLNPAIRNELETLLEGLKDLRDGDFETRLPTGADSLIAELFTAFNGIAERNEDLSRKITVDVQGEILELKVAVFVDLYLKQEQIKEQSDLLAESKRRELELQHRAELLESEAKSAAQLAELNNQLHNRQMELEQAMGVRNRFYASMSHELRTPINAVIGYSTLLIDNIYGPLNEKQREGLQRTLKAARHLLELVNDVLDLSKIEAGKIELALQPVNIGALIDDLFVTVRPLADEHDSQLSFEFPAEPPTVTTDPRRVRQILLNLLSNAIKFGRRKPIKVQATPTESGGVVISVIDHGEGISEEDKARVFEEFVQVSPTQQPGTGLGLPISRRLATLLDGSLEMESVLGEGSTFRLILPREATPRTFDVDEFATATAA
jgi:signal transduction histidine kinase